MCLENMPFRGHRISTMDRIVEVVREVNSPFAGICFDTGHSLVFGRDLGEDARIAAPYLKCLHIHGNDGTKDAHQVPADGDNIDWNGFTAALAEVGYSGVMSLECMGNIPDVPVEERTPYEKETWAAGRALAYQVEKAMAK